MKNLVIVESPAKAKTLEKFLGEDYKVMSSYGHIRDLKKKDFSVNEENFTPMYEIPSDKTKLVSDLKAAAKKADTVWLASDEDREGEAISWHLATVLGLDVKTTKRIVFHEITKDAILEAIKKPRHIDANLVNAQQARRVLDRIVGFKLSPVLWKKLKPALSAGRVQSVAVRLIVEREREIQNFQAESNYKVVAEFVGKDEKTDECQMLKAEFENRFATEEEAVAFLNQCQTCDFVISDISKKPMRKVPAPPFTTSTLQQEAARKLGFSVAQTMSVAQHLYESGQITYMRTDSVNLSSLCVNASKKEIVEKLGAEYSKVRKYQTKSKGAQEAHEAIRPTYMNNHTIKGTLNERRLYELIWKRTIASQMADAEFEKTTIRIDLEGAKPNEGAFFASGEVVLFDGFLKVYRESFDEEQDQDEIPNNAIDSTLSVGQALTFTQMTATQRFSQGPLRFTEASLVKKLEELGIGRPSTYAPTISTIQQREYVEKGDKLGEARSYQILTMKNGKSIKKTEKKEMVGKEKGKLLPTDTGVVVNDFLVQYFPDIVNYNFTAQVEKDFDEIAEGKENWQEMMRSFYNALMPEIDKAMHIQLDHKVGERVLGTDPVSGKEVTVKIGRFGPIVQIGSSTDTEKPRFAQLLKGQSLQTLTLDEALELFKLPRMLGDYQGKEVTVGAGRFGPYVLYNKTYVSLPKGVDPMAITLDEAIDLIEEKKKQEAAKHIKTFEEEPELEIMNGRYGPYIAYKGKNYRLPKTVKDPASLTLEKCLDIVKK